MQVLKFGSLVAVAVFLFFLGNFSTAYAHDAEFKYPLLAKERLTIGARIEQSWYSGKEDGPVSYLTEQVQDEFGVGVVGAYALTGGEYPLSLVGGTVYALDSKFFRSWIGLNVRLYSGRGD
jgi:hypothetical protein